jgi:hypothetical protein
LDELRLKSIKERLATPIPLVWVRFHLAQNILQFVFINLGNNLASCIRGQLNKSLLAIHII